MKKEPSQQTEKGKSSLCVHTHTRTSIHTPFVFRFVNAIYMCSVYICNPPILCVEHTHYFIIWQIYFVIFTPCLFSSSTFVFFFSFYPSFLSSYLCILICLISHALHQYHHNMTLGISVQSSLLLFGCLVFCSYFFCVIFCLLIRKKSIA